MEHQTDMYGAQNVPSVPPPEVFPPGWYECKGEQRYWDGNDWTEHTAPLPPQINDLSRKSVEATYAECSAARLYAAVVHTITELGYSITTSDQHTGTVSFRTGLSWKSWRGQEMTATVISVPPTSAKVVMGGRRVTRGYQFQLADSGEAKSIARKVIRKLTPILAGTPEPTRNEQTGSMSNELAQLAQLYQNGLLTDEEFAAGKSRLLS